MSNGKLYTCDLVCLGAASPKGFQEYISWLSDLRGKRVKSYKHRGSFVPWGTYLERATFEDGSVEIGTTETRVWKRIWSKQMLRPSCSKCKYHSVDRVGNITLGDFWGLENVYPELYDTRGVSALMVNDEKGLELCSNMSISCYPCKLSELANEKQPMLNHPPMKALSSDHFWSIMNSEGFAAAVRDAGLINSKRRVKDFILRLKEMINFRAKNHRKRRIDTPEAVSNLDEYSEGNRYPLCFAAYNRSDLARSKGSSGGLFMAAAEYIIKEGGVVYGCAFDDNLIARHIRCTSVEDCERCVGTKYSQSNFLDVLKLVKKDLDEGATVLFTGTPCQVDAVKAVSYEYR